MHYNKLLDVSKKHTIDKCPFTILAYYIKERFAYSYLILLLLYRIVVKVGLYAFFHVKLINAVILLEAEMHHSLHNFDIVCMLYNLYERKAFHLV